jgi:cell division septation protein DedD
MEAEERDITIGPGKLLGLFFMLVAICGVFFAIGYSLGKTSAREQALNDKTSLNASLSAPVVGDASAPKPSAAVQGKGEPEGSASSQQEKAPTGPDLTFFNAVKQSEGAGQPATEAAKPTASKVEPQASSAAPAGASEAPAAAQPTTGTAESKAAPKTEVTAPASGTFVVQIAAVTREEDAAALAGALRKKSYSVFVVNNQAVHDKFYHVQVGPFATLQDAEAMKAKLTGEGYNPIVKRS